MNFNSWIDAILKLPRLLVGLVVGVFILILCLAALPLLIFVRKEVRVAWGQWTANRVRAATGESNVD